MNMTKETILTKLQFWAKTTPDKICLIEAATDTAIGYSEFWERILRFAASIPSNKRFIIKTRQTINHLALFYAVQAAGSTAIPAESTATDERLKNLAEEFDAEILSSEYNFDVAPINFSPPDAENISCVILSTGTTGKNKGVMSSFRCRFCGADNVRVAYDITEKDIALIPQMLSHSGGLRRVEAMLISGATAVIMNSAMLFGNVFAAIKKYRCNILQFVPAQVSQILNRAEKLLLQVAPQLEIVSVGSAAISEHDKERLREILPNVRLFNDFGSTEAVGSAYFEWSAFPPKPNCVGVEGIHARIVFLNEQGEVMTSSSRDNPGLIATEGGVLMSGYLNEPELTAKVMRNGKVLSADLGYRGEDGMIYILGRKDDIIISGGNKISPREIEDAVMNIDGVKECACVPRPDKIMGQMPALFIVWGKTKKSAAEVVTLLEQKLDRFKVPRAEHIYEIKKLPRTDGTGKILTRELIERFEVDENA